MASKKSAAGPLNSGQWTEAAEAQFGGALARKAQCDRCALAKLHLQYQTGVSPCLGPRPETPVVVVAPAPEDEQEERPFTGKDGAYFRRVIKQLGINRELFSYTYAIACPSLISDDWTWARMRRLVRERAKARREAAKELHKKQMDRYKALKALNPKEKLHKPTLAECLRAEELPPPLLLPDAACRPRVQAEVRKPSTILCLGSEPFWSVTGRKSKIMKIYGTFIEYEDKKVCPVISLKNLRARRRLERSFKLVVSKAVQWHYGTLEVPVTEVFGLPPQPGEREAWKPPSLGTIQRWLDELEESAVVAYDLETTDINAMVARIRTIQLATSEKAFVIYVRSKEPKETSYAQDHHPLFYSPEDTKRLFLKLEKFFKRKSPRFVGLNNILYDNLVLIREGLRWLGRPIQVHRPIDLLTLHRVADPDVPHSLAFQGVMYTVVTDWKASQGGEESFDPKSDHELGKYGGTDGTTTHQIFEPVYEDLTADDGGGPQGPQVYQHDVKLAHVCQGMKQIGYYVDQEERARLESLLYQVADYARNECARALGHLGHPAVEGNAVQGFRFKEGKKGKPLFSLSSPEQQAELFYGQGPGSWNLPPPKDLITPFDPEETDYVEWVRDGMKAKFYSKEGNPSTGDPIMRAYLAEQEINEWQALYFSELRRVRKALKLVQDKLIPSRLLSPSDYDSEGYPIHRKGGKKWPVSAVWEDGILRTGWKLGPPLGRLASGDPLNAQNFSKLVRSILTAPPGHCLVGADFDQLHLKIIANIWRIPSLVDDFIQGRDPHQTMAELTFGDTYRNAEGYPKKGYAGRMRNWGKTIRFTGAYGGSPNAIFSVMQKADTGADLESDTDDLLQVLIRQAWRLTNLQVQKKQVQAFYNQWMKNEPEWQEAWREALQSFEHLGYVQDDILGRRAYLRDGTQLFTKVPNARVLMNEGALAGRATWEIAERIPFGSWSEYTGVVEQCHDAIVVCVPIERAQEAKKIVDECMNIWVDGHPVQYTATADIGYRRTKVA